MILHLGPGVIRSTFLNYYLRELYKDCTFLYFFTTLPYLAFLKMNFCPYFLFWSLCPKGHQRACPYFWPHTNMCVISSFLGLLPSVFMLSPVMLGLLPLMYSLFSSVGFSLSCVSHGTLVSSRALLFSSLQLL